jgi:hypothetical protein
MAPRAATGERQAFTAETLRVQSEFLEAHPSVCSSLPW